MKVLLNSILIIALIAAGLFFFVFSKLPEVKVMSVQRGLAVDAVSGNLNIFSANSMILRSELPGRVYQTITPPNTGPFEVKKGDVIIQLDSIDVKRELELARVRLDTAVRTKAAGSVFDSMIGDTKADLELQEEQAENGHFPTADLNKTRRLLKSLELQLEQEQAKLDEDIAHKKSEVKRLESDLKRLSVVSPINGFVTEVITPVGDLVSHGTPVARLISKENVVEVSLSEEDFKYIAPGQRVTARLLSQGQILYEGEVTTLLAEADSMTRRRSVYIFLDAPDEVLVPGMTGQASITKAERDNVLVVPRRALLGAYVYVVENGKVRLRPIQTGFMSLNMVEVIDGLKEGDQVIVETPHLYREGEAVEAIPVSKS